MTAPRLSLQALTKRYGALTALAPLDLDASRRQHSRHPRRERRRQVDAGASDRGGDPSRRRHDRRRRRRRCRPAIRARRAPPASASCTSTSRSSARCRSPRTWRSDGRRRRERGSRRRASPPTRGRSRPRTASTSATRPSPAARCRSGCRRAIEILRALSASPRVLLLDEPTAVLTPPEIDELFASLRRLRADGMLVLFITHKLEEALGLCDAVSVLRGGKLVTTVAARDVSARELAHLMVGADAALAATRAAPAPATYGPARNPWRLSCATSRPMPAPGRVALDDVSLTIAAGEICGIAGVDGNGQDELAAALAGLTPRRGTVVVHGTTLAGRRRTRGGARRDRAHSRRSPPRRARPRPRRLGERGARGPAARALHAPRPARRRRRARVRRRPGPRVSRRRAEPRRTRSARSRAATSNAS